MYHISHTLSSESRGYGTISRQAPTVDLDGTHQFYVEEWERPRVGARNTSISASHLDLSLVHHKDRTPPTGLDQPILVVVGPHKAATGTTIAKVCPLASHA